MSYVMKTNLSRKENYGDKRSTSDIKYIVIHYTANDGDSDESNAKYFHNNVVKASAHYFVDDDSITQSVPDDFVAWSVGGKKYSDCAKTGGGTLHCIVTNANSISVEMCDTKRDGSIMATESTMANTAEFVKTLMKKYNIDINHVVRHFDVNGKHCPAYLMNANAWSKFKDRLATSVASSAPESTNTTKTTNASFMVHVDVCLNVRKGPGVNYDVTGNYATKGKYTIVEETNGWGKLKSGAGWITLNPKYVTRL